jgi:hypothetical protein
MISYVIKGFIKELHFYFLHLIKLNYDQFENDTFQLIKNVNNIQRFFFQPTNKNKT